MPTPTERLNTYRDARADLPAAIAAARADRMPQTQIAHESGLSREGVRKITARQEIPMRTLTIDATLATLTGRYGDRATIAEALRAADTRRRAETDATNPGPRPRSVEVYARWGAARERVPGGNGRDWTADPAELAEMVTRAQTMVDDPTNRYDDWRVVTHGPGTPERAAYVAQVLADLEASDRATARAAKTDGYPAECDSGLVFRDEDALADHITGCGVCTQAEIDHLDAEDDR